VVFAYLELLEHQEENRAAFGRMLLSWRRRNGWTHYTACSWAEEAGFDTISYGNLSVIEQASAGELRQKALWQLGELNRRIDAKEWGTVKSLAIKEKLEGSIPLGEDDCPVRTPIEMWACYCGLREVPDPFRTTHAPTVGQRMATELTSKWRSRCAGSSTNAASNPVTPSTPWRQGPAKNTASASTPCSPFSATTSPRNSVLAMGRG